MAGHSLLTRIRNPEYAIARRSISDSETRDSILEHLKQIVTTRRGGMPTCPDYGLVDVSELLHSFPEAIAMLAKSIRHSIQTYEPRLTNVIIKHVPGEDLVVRFEISGSIKNSDGRTPVKFETNIDPSRKIDVL